ncbi:hypothetical protein SADUNF_Sadunf04G0000400 [Salix dunnii]|uniref:Uncharacterized protein n=1 Tax=Salix dunnii TaxID=1413687 RepID=A0A835K306_9ROSI|nr:hypothetical protein SADUNF_Sadunf04G0000400 [Salix dunnii]
MPTSVAPFLLLLSTSWPGAGERVKEEGSWPLELGKALFLRRRHQADQRRLCPMKRAEELQEDRHFGCDGQGGEVAVESEALLNKTSRKHGLREEISAFTLLPLLYSIHFTHSCCFPLKRDGMVFRNESIRKRVVIGLQILVSKEDITAKDHNPIEFAPSNSQSMKDNNTTVIEYLNYVKSLVNSLIQSSATMDDDEFISYILDGLGLEYKELATTLHLHPDINFDQFYDLALKEEHLQK